MNASLRELVLAVRYGDASLVGESVGYIILGAADRAQTVARRADLDSILLTGEGEVALDAAVCSAEDAERSLRVLLGGLLTLVRSPCPNLERVARRQHAAGLPHLVVELEAALVPVNRKAARRALSRLVREARRSAVRAEQHVAVAAVLPEENRSWGASPAEPADEPVAQVEPEFAGPDADPSLDVARSVLAVREDWPVAEEGAPAETPGGSRALPCHAPPCHAPEEDVPPARAPVERAWPTHPVSSDSLAMAGSRGRPSEQRPDAPGPGSGDAASSQDPGSLDDSGGLDAGWGATSIFEVPLEDELDDAETRLCAPVVAIAPPRPARPVALFLHAGRAELPADLPLIASRPSAPTRRPSDAAELLGGGRLHHGPSSELYKSLKQLSQVDASRPTARGASS